MNEAVAVTNDHDTLIRVETKLDVFTQEIRQSNTDFKDQLKDHENRLRSLESSQEQQSGHKVGSTEHVRDLRDNLETIGIILAALAAIAAFVYSLTIRG